MATRCRWTPEAIPAEVEPSVAELGRMATGGELVARGFSGRSSALQRYGGVARWCERTAFATRSGEVDVTCGGIARYACFGSLEGDGGGAVARWLDAQREPREAARR
jgi:hypothetical protein